MCRLCDLDGDGHQDLLLTIDKTKQTTYAFIIFLRNQGDGTFKKSEQGMEGEYTFHEVVYLDGKPGLTAVKTFINCPKGTNNMTSTYSNGTRTST